MALSRVVSEIFNVEKCRDLEIGVKGFRGVRRRYHVYNDSRLGYRDTIILKMAAVNPPEFPYIAILVM